MQQDVKRIRYHDKMDLLQERKVDSTYENQYNTP